MFLETSEMDADWSPEHEALRSVLCASGIVRADPVPGWRITVHTTEDSEGRPLGVLTDMTATLRSPDAVRDGKKEGHDDR